MFERRHYESIAKVIFEAKKRARGSAAEECGVGCTEIRLAWMFHDDNPHFDAKRFFAATGTNPDERKHEWYLDRKPQKEGITQ